jgi:hypothetical protein
MVHVEHGKFLVARRAEELAWTSESVGRVLVEMPSVNTIQFVRNEEQKDVDNTLPSRKARQTEATAWGRPRRDRVIHIIKRGKGENIATEREHLVLISG